MQKHGKNSMFCRLNAGDFEHKPRETTCKSERCVQKTTGKQGVFEGWGVPGGQVLPRAEDGVRVVTRTEFAHTGKNLGSVIVTKASNG